MSQKHHILQDIESKQLLRELLNSNKFTAIFYRYSSSLIFTLAYGKRMMNGNEEGLKGFVEVVKEVLQEVDGNLIVDTFPILDYLPRCVAAWKERGTFRLSEVKHLEREELALVIGVLYEAAHTTPMVLEVFVMASVLHQDAVCRAQRELDIVVGLDRVPTFEDMPSLPYVNAFVREVFRWRPITPGGMHHAVIEGDEHMGYRIPKGTTVVANHWSLNLDGELFEHPYGFRPERWIANPNLPESAFGFGRRVCPGKHIGRNSVLLIIARIIWAYHMDHTYENGKKQDIDPWEMTQGPNSQPIPFKASFRIRSLGH
ncbi:hypothetical protein G7Y89_g5181 [Cudoniella acicularis]|uniref:Cytochrome P450 n=1 Tax=Cudoniella acicularis TaxID=354080 RepID=A0A8H4RQ67_9HELO|nr:hypothetical protein G7Y89_g5181 [Cudoniella acicularis]